MEVGFRGQEDNLGIMEKCMRVTRSLWTWHHRYKIIQCGDWQMGNMMKKNRTNAFHKTKLYLAMVPAQEKQILVLIDEKYDEKNKTNAFHKTILYLEMVPAQNKQILVLIDDKYDKKTKQKKILFIKSNCILKQFLHTTNRFLVLVNEKYHEEKNRKKKFINKIVS